MIIEEFLNEIHTHKAREKSKVVGMKYCWFVLFSSFQCFVLVEMQNEPIDILFSSFENK
jgi:hypothetical protein